MSFMEVSTILDVYSCHMSLPKS
uniref:Uncharacterized protein n=1 Tax=Arundo donax TaxID=35708 RepID=A0A0A9C756_ARUDO